MNGVLWPLPEGALFIKDAAAQLPKRIFFFALL